MNIFIRTKSNQAKNICLMAACLRGFDDGVSARSQPVPATSACTPQERAAWLGAFLAGARAAGYLAHGSEHAHQRALFELAFVASRHEPLLELLYAVPNGGQRNKIVASKLKAEGVKPGVPDVCLPVPRHGHGALYLELKREKGGRLSNKQSERGERMRQAGNRVVVVHGWREAATELFAYIA